jgi:hypothetical protein
MLVKVVGIKQIQKNDSSKTLIQFDDSLKHGDVPYLRHFWESVSITVISGKTPVEIWSIIPMN